ncbi:MAG: aminotransferase class I/II-fold pyridoxal phosphate-dependent enzyme [Thermoplasmata archaeon]
MAYGLVSSIPTSGIRKFFNLASKESINLGIGEPDFQPPKYVQMAAKKAITMGFNKYGPSSGLPELREAIAQKYRKYADLKAENVIITMGGTEAFYLALYSLLESNDEVLVPDPGFVIYAPHVTLAGGIPVSYPLQSSKKFVLDLADLEPLITSRTKAIIVNSPSNPLGTVLSEREIKNIIEFAMIHDLYIISDEVYMKIVFDRDETTFLGKYDKLIFINSFSKEYAMTGWRIGYLIASRKLIEPISKLQYYLIACPATPLQYGALAAIQNSDQFTRNMVRSFKKRRDLALHLFSGIPQFSQHVPDGTFYLFPAYSLSLDDDKFAISLLKNGVVVAPGTAFGSNGAKHIRISYATSPENIKKGIELIKETVEFLLLNV